MSACFRCCLLHATASREQNQAFWAERLSSHFIGEKHGVDRPDSVLLGHNSDLRFADIGGVYSNNKLEGVNPTLAASHALVSLQGGADWVTKGQHASLWQRLGNGGGELRRITLFSMGDEDLPPLDSLGRLGSHEIAAWFVNSPSMLTAHPKLQACNCPFLGCEKLTMHSP